MGAELLHADGRMDRQTDRQTDMTKLIVPLRNFSNAPKKGFLFRRKKKALFHQKDFFLLYVE